MASTEDSGYTQRLVNLESKGWKKLLDVQRPYRWRLAHAQPGRTLDVGCGLGRNLRNLPDGVGVDHNADSVKVAQARGLRAYTTAEWDTCPDANLASYDSLLLAHVLEHLDPDTALAILRSYLPYLKPNGQLIFICPQEVGYRSDSTHVRFLDIATLSDIARAVGFEAYRTASFPLPRAAGKLFKYNEFWVQARRG